MKTYKEIAEKAELSETASTRYIKYMMTRWADSESVKCQVGYAMEWALRFKSGTEWDYSDSIGQAVLEQLDR